MFMREFSVIDAATSEEQLRLRLKPTELEQYGEAFIPEFVYEMIRQLPRFKDMKVSILLCESQYCELTNMSNSVASSRTFRNF